MKFIKFIYLVRNLLKMKNIDLKKIALSLFPYAFVAFIALFPLLEQALEKIDSDALLYIIYFLFLTSLLIFIPFKKALSFILILVSLLFIGYRIKFNKYIGLDDITSILDSNLDESIGYIFESGNYLIITTSFIISVIIIFFLKFSKINILKPLTIFVISAISLYFFEMHYHDISLRYPIKIPKDYFIYKNEIKRISLGYRNKSNEKIYSAKDSDINIILVIGESSRNDYYSTCKPNKFSATPNLESISKDKNLISFCDAKSVSLSTRYSVTSMLSSQNIRQISKVQDHKNIIHVFNNYGLATNVFENNMRQEEEDNIHKSIVLANFIPAKSVYFSKSDLDLDFFREIIPVIKKQDKTFNIIHMKGNHITYDETYPEDFLKESKNNSYYKSVRYTDLALSYLINEVSLMPKKAVVVYLSDHGEYVNDYLDDVYSHGVLALRRYGGKQEVLDFLTDIPFFIYMNNEFVKRYPDVRNRIEANKDKVISQDNVFSTLVGILNSGNGVVDKDLKNYKETYDLTSNKLKENTRYIYNSDIDYNMLESDTFIKIHD